MKVTTPQLCSLLVHHHVSSAQQDRGEPLFAPRPACPNAANSIYAALRLFFFAIAVSLYPIAYSASSSHASYLISSYKYGLALYAATLFTRSSVNDFKHREHQFLLT